MVYPGKDKDRITGTTIWQPSFMRIFIRVNKFPDRRVKRNNYITRKKASNMKLQRHTLCPGKQILGKITTCYGRVSSAFFLSYVILFCSSVPAFCQLRQPLSWKFESQRKSIAPVWYADNRVSYEGAETLVLKGGGKKYADGHWYSMVAIEPVNILHSGPLLRPQQ